MGKVSENKQLKFEKLAQKAYELFTSKGVERTSISDITDAAGIAKGTFYLYFKDKYELRDYLIAQTSGKLFTKAIKSMKHQSFDSLEDEIIFLVDHIITQLSKNKIVLHFISKNLSWGIFHEALNTHSDKADISLHTIFHMLTDNRYGTKLRDPEIMLFMIVELASSTCYTTILHNDPVTFDELKPYLNDAVRSMIRHHIIEDVTEPDGNE